MKHIFISSLVAATLASTGLAAAPASASQGSVFDGPYVGAALGGNYVTATQKGSLVESDVYDPYGYSLSASSNINRLSPMGAVFAGYGKVFGKFYAAAEIFGNESAYKNTKTIRSSDPDGVPGFNQSNTLYLSPFQYGIDFRPGFIVTPTTLLYGRVGVVEATKKITSRFYDANLAGTQSIQVGGTSKREHVNGLRLGLGVSHYLTGHLSLDADYIFTDYGSIKATQGTGQVVYDRDAGDVSNYTNNSRFTKIFTNAVTVGATYHFE